MGADAPLPLSGVRIIDLTMAWAGPMAVRFLADMGAEVVKIEAASHMDRWRGGTFAQRGTDRYPDHTPGERPWNRSSFFNTQNRNKKSLVLDLKTAKGKEIFKQLVAVSDLVAENFSAGAMGRLNLDYPVLREIKPDIIMLSMPAFGRTGPERDFIAHGPTIEEIAGTAALQGYADGPPMPSGGLAWGDPVAGMNGAAAAMIALVHRQETGKGQHIDLSHVEVGAGFNIDALLTYTMLGRNTPRRGNQDRSMAPHGAYPCAGEDRWIAIAVRSDAEWCALKGVMGTPAWAEDGRYDTVTGRWEHQRDLDKHLSAWTAKQEPRALTERLQAAGISAGPLNDARDLSDDPHLHARGFFETVTHPEAGTHEYPGMPWKLSGTPTSIRMPAPLFGQHNEEVLTGLLGMSAAEVRALEAEGVITTQPHPQGD